jgi:hypothetical protein
MKWRRKKSVKQRRMKDFVFSASVWNSKQNTQSLKISNILTLAFNKDAVYRSFKNIWDEVKWNNRVFRWSQNFYMNI